MNSFSEFPLLSLQDVHYRYAGSTEHVLSGISVNIHPGRITALMGPSGIGKSTLLRIIAGLARPTGGRVIFKGKQLSALHRPHIGLMAQNCALVEALTVLGNVMLGVAAREGQQERKARALEWLKRVGLEGFKSRHPPALSGGQQSRVALARAMASHPDILMLDEPFKSLDVMARQGFYEHIRQEQNGTNYITAVLVTHDIEEAFERADLVAVLRPGEKAPHFMARADRVGTWMPQTVESVNTLEELLKGYLACMGKHSRP